MVPERLALVHVADVHLEDRHAGYDQASARATDVWVHPPGLMTMPLIFPTDS